MVDEDAERTEDDDDLNTEDEICPDCNELLEDCTCDDDDDDEEEE